jgi:hypothetical protein
MDSIFSLGGQRRKGDDDNDDDERCSDEGNRCEEAQSRVKLWLSREAAKRGHDDEPRAVKRRRMSRDDSPPSLTTSFSSQTTLDREGETQTAGSKTSMAGL